MKIPSQNASTPEFSLAEEGIHRMRLLSASEPILSQFKKPNGDDKWQVKLTFQIDDDESESDGELLDAYASISMHAKSAMYPIVKALMGGAEIDPDAEIDLDDLVGNYVMGTVTHVTRPSKNNPGETRTFANLTGFAPVRKKKKVGEPIAPKAKPAAKPPVDEEDDPFENDEDSDAA